MKFLLCGNDEEIMNTLKIVTIGKFFAVSAIAISCYLLLIVANAHGPGESITPKRQQPIPNIPGKTFTSVIVNFPPGAKADSHRHGEAFVYAYVLSGKIRSQLDDEPAKIYQTGEDWFEPPGVLHRVTENVSKSKPAKLLAIFVADTGAPLKTPETPAQYSRRKE
jgi:quercetin dioxygenase-like cupin family protein